MKLIILCAGCAMLWCVFEAVQTPMRAVDRVLHQAQEVSK